MENVQHIMNVRFIEAIRQDGAGEVRVALEIERRAADELVHVWVAPRPEEIVNPATNLVDAIRR